ncbi:hypothetical protein [Nocardioides houyundeii]|uniref:hypothetical protein n=1 Tax=Nocardioides houyundeii TaxID=2045452 RepID=UPI0018EF610D|nr:hypothetical protein [Nocardioides houyundeii]
MAYDVHLADRVRSVVRFEMRGRPLHDWLHVAPSATADDQDLTRWVEVGLAYAASLPPK